MKQFTILLVLFSIITSCVSKEIEYKDVENITIVKLDSKEITLSADAIFKNPNVYQNQL